MVTTPIRYTSGSMERSGGRRETGLGVDGETPPTLDQFRPFDSAGVRRDGHGWNSLLGSQSEQGWHYWPSSSRWRLIGLETAWTEPWQESAINRDRVWLLCRSCA